MLGLEPLSLDGAMLDEARAYLRFDSDQEDTTLPGALLAAIGHAETFTRSILLRRVARETVIASSGWQALHAAPVQAVTGVTGIPAEGATFQLAADAWEAKIGSRGEAYVGILRPGSAGRAEIACIAGLATDWAALPEALRMGLLRLTAHFHGVRDAPEASAPPASALALLLPWRRVRVG
jgi:uncharacterized phiE125 gp8 family phage protein